MSLFAFVSLKILCDLVPSKSLNGFRLVPLLLYGFSGLLFVLDIVANVLCVQACIYILSYLLAEPFRFHGFAIGVFKTSLKHEPNQVSQFVGRSERQTVGYTCTKGRKAHSRIYTLLQRFLRSNRCRYRSRKCKFKLSVFLGLFGFQEAATSAGVAAWMAMWHFYAYKMSVSFWHLNAVVGLNGNI